MIAALIAAATPPIAPPIDVHARIGQPGQWFGPAVLVAVALIVDATAAGSVAKRDRLAAIATYTAGLGFISIYGWSRDIQRWFDGSWSLQLTGSAISVLVHVAFLVVLLGDFTKKQESTVKRFSLWAAPRAGIGSPDSLAVGRLNTKLHVSAFAVAMTYTLGRGDITVIQRAIGNATTTAGSAVVNFVIDRLGG